MMASTKVLGNTPSANTFLAEPKKRKKKKSKKVKKEKSDKQKLKPKVGQRLKDYADIGDLNLYEQWAEIKKKKRKKKHDVGLKEEFPLTQNKNLKLSKRHKNNKSIYHALETGVLGHGVRSRPGAQEALQPILSSVQREKKRKKRVAFNLPPELLEPEPLQNPYAFLQTRRFVGLDKESAFNAGLMSGDGHQSKPPVEEHGMESQSMSDDINSQDLFITQKSFSDPYIDLCSSTSAEEAQGYTGTPRELQSHTASSVKKETSPEPQSYTVPSLWKSPEHQYYTASCPEPKTPPCALCQPSPPKRPSYHRKLDASTQTENFFTAPFLATSLRFRHWSTCTEAPMDLSLPKRSRLHQQDVVVSKASEEQNVTDLTQSDDSDSHLKSKADLSQLKVVQTRLNESFFFKLKGDLDSPKPRSPLMKFAGSVDKKKP